MPQPDSHRVGWPPPFVKTMKIHGLYKRLPANISNHIKVVQSLMGHTGGASLLGCRMFRHIVTYELLEKYLVA